MLRMVLVARLLHETELYYYEGGRLAQITDGSNKLKFFFTRDAAGSLLNMIDYTSATPVTYTYVYDAHGNVVGLADKNGAIPVTYVYDAWGNIIGGQNGGIFTGDGQVLRDANPFRYASYQYDAETGFYYLKSRYYSPSLGRFLTRDVVPSHFLGRSSSGVTEALQTIERDAGRSRLLQEKRRMLLDKTEKNEA